MRIPIGTVVFVALSAALAVPAAAQSQGAAAQAAQSASGTDLQALVGRLEAARLDYTKNRPADAQRELLSAIDLLHAMQAKGSPQSGAGGGRKLPRGGRDVPMPGLLKRAEPEYPIETAKRGVTGYVVLDVVINKSGKVRDPRVAKSVPELDHAALKAVGGWQFAKPTVNGTPGNIAALLVLAFTLRREPLLQDDIDLGRFYVERGEYAGAEAPLARALEAITRENECMASTSYVVGARGRGGAGAIEPPRKIKDVKPVYPGIAQEARVTGVVIIDAVIDANGRVSCMRVLRSVPLLDQPALDAVSQWEFTPVLLNGAPVPARMTVTVNFTLQ
jgi:TonB family protein